MTMGTSMPARALLVVAAILLAPTAGRGEEPAATLRALLAQYHCAVVDRLEQIYRAEDSSDPQNLFLIIDFAARPNDYVQCVFDTRTLMLCEAASGSYDDLPAVPRSRRLPANAIAANVSCMANPIASPTAICSATSSAAAQDSVNGADCWIVTASKEAMTKASATLTRTGIAAELNPGAAANSARVRTKGQKKWPSQR